MNEIREPTLILSLAEFCSGGQQTEDRSRPQLEMEAVEAELHTLAANVAAQDRVLASLFPEGVPHNAQLIESIYRLGVSLHESEQSGRLTALLMRRVFQAIPAEDKQSLLASLPSADNLAFWMAIELLQTVLPEIALPQSFMSDWFLSMADRVGNDMAGGRLFSLVVSYAERHPDDALDMFDAYAEKRFVGNRGTLAHLILGVVRAVSPSSSALGKRIRHLDRSLSRHQRLECRLCYHRSLLTTFQRTGVSRSTLKKRLGRMMEGDDAEVAAAFFVLAGYAIHGANDPRVVRLALRWLASSVRSDLPSQAKFHAAALLDSLIHHKSFAPGSRDSAEMAGLMSRLQPIPAADKGTWERVLQFSTRFAACGSARLAELWTSLAEGNPGHLIMHDLDHNADVCFWHEMQETDPSEFVARMLISRSRIARRYGRVFFERLPVVSFPEAVMAQIPESRLIVALLEQVRKPPDGQVLARFFLAMAPHMKSASQATLERFKHEATLQAVNFPASFLESVKAATGEHPFLQEVVDAAEAYFERVRPLQNSPINAFGRHEVSKAGVLFTRKISQFVKEGVEKNSLLAMIAGKPIAMLYGSRFATHVDGKMGDATDFKSFSHSSEWPRLPSIDPDGEACKALACDAEIRTLGADEHEQ